MSDLLVSVTNYLVTLPWLELVAMLLALAYVILAAQGSIWCWPAAFISTAIYTIIFYDVSLLMDSALNVYYLVMAVYGFWLWNKHSPSGDEQSSAPLTIVSWAAVWHLKACLILLILSVVLGYIMANTTTASFPYIDTFTTVFAVFSTYLVAQKVLENWLYWIIIDAVSIYLYIEKGLIPTAVLFTLYVIIAVFGYLKWQSIYRQSRAKEVKLSTITAD